MSKEPYFPFYYRDFMVSTGEMTDAEVGKYLRYLIHQWEKGSIPSNPAMIQTIRFDSDLWGTLEFKFPLGNDGRRRNPRLEEIRIERDQYIAKRSAAGKRGAEARYGKRTAIANAIASGKQDSKQDGKTIASTSTSTSTPLAPTLPRRKKRVRREYPALFERLWAVHPKGGKDAAYKAMNKFDIDSLEIDGWTKKLEAYKATEQWQRGVSPNLSTWINQGYFDGELPEEKTLLESIKEDREAREAVRKGNRLNE